MEEHYKIVKYWDYCETCKHFDKSQNEEPCDECLSVPARIDSGKPINYEKADTRK